jgi:CDGSH-type Zn-finger protein
MRAMDAKPKIACAPNGPYLLADAPVRRTAGEVLATKPVALCRCGGSKNKPFCDGTHGKIGFNDRSTADPGKDRRKSYAGKKITILDNRSICAHAGVCTEELKEVFRQHDSPWIVPDAGEEEALIAIIEKCPSGALGYAIGVVEPEAPKRPPMVTVTDHGPYAVTGGVELAGVRFGQGASTEHYTLCRCGASQNKPFCDGSHWEVKFRDPQ